MTIQANSISISSHKSHPRSRTAFCQLSIACSNAAECAAAAVSVNCATVVGHSVEGNNTGCYVDAARRRFVPGARLSALNGWLARWH